MTNHQATWRDYYEKSLSTPHRKRTEHVLSLNQSGLNVAIDCGCGTGNDIDFLAQNNYQVFGFDVSAEAISICEKRFENNIDVNIQQASFENYQYPKTGLLIANSSLFFANPKIFNATWKKMSSAIEVGGLFAGEFLGLEDTWATHYRSPTTALSAQAIKSLFNDFEVVQFHERKEVGKTRMGRTKHWHIYSVIALKTAPILKF